MSVQEKGQGVTRSGFVAIVGRPNVGKSTLLNHLVGQKVAIVSSRPQTTRNRVLGVLTKDGCQMVFLDTPGLHAPRNKLGDYMMRQADSAVRSVDLVVLVVEPTDKIETAELSVLERCGCPVLLAINKIDTVKKEALLAVIAAYASAYDFAAVVPLSALRGEGVEELYDELQSRLPDGPAFFPEDALTDQTERQLVAEFIREKALLFMRDEIPHGIAVVVERFKERPGTDLIDIDVNIYCERESHKGMVIGKGGAMLKKIASAARADCEEFLGCRVNLQCWVKVKSDWRDNEFLLNNFGFKQNSSNR